MEQTSVKKGLGTHPKSIMSIKYVQEGPGSPNSLTYGPYKADLGKPNSFAWSNTSSAQTWHDLMRYSFTAYPIGDNKYMIVTSYRADVVDAVDAGLMQPHLEYLMPNFLKWRAAGEEPHGIEYVKTPKFGGFIMDFHERLVNGPADPIFGKYVTDIIAYQGPINRVGEMLSRKEVLRQAWLRYKESPEGIELESLKGAGEEISYLGIDPRESVVSAIGRLPYDQKIVLFNGINFHDYISKLAERNRLSYEDVVKAVLGEEDMHRLRSSYDKPLGLISPRLAEETVTKMELWQLYKGLAENTPNENLRTRYLKIAGMIEHDMATIDRYRTLYISKNKKSVDDIVMALRHEAHEKGIPEDQIEDYIENKLSEAVNDNVGNDLEKIISSGKTTTSASRVDNSKNGRNDKSYRALSKNYKADNENRLEAEIESTENYDSENAETESSENTSNNSDGLISEANEEISEEVANDSEAAANDNNPNAGTQSEAA